MNSIFLMINPIQIVFFLGLLITIIISSLVLASKHEERLNFLIWVLLILFLPYIGGISYLIKHFTSRKIKAA